MIGIQVYQNEGSSLHKTGNEGRFLRATIDWNINVFLFTLVPTYPIAYSDMQNIQSPTENVVFSLLSITYTIFYIMSWWQWFRLNEFYYCSFKKSFFHREQLIYVHVPSYTNFHYAEWKKNRAYKGKFSSQIYINVHLVLIRIQNNETGHCSFFRIERLHFCYICFLFFPETRKSVNNKSYICRRVKIIPLPL
jgi:hypothetical protein